MICPCGSGADYADCCQPIVSGEKKAETAEQLMRARYSAYTQVEMDFLFNSIHPDGREENDRDGARDWAENSQWHGLEVIEISGGTAEDDTGTVEFAANYTHEDADHRYHEVATFKKEDGQWYFAEGKPGVRKPVVREEPKIGRNDPCPCGSGRKYKRCCAQ